MAEPLVARRQRRDRVRPEGGGARCGGGQGRGPGGAGRGAGFEGCSSWLGPTRNARVERLLDDRQSVPVNASPSTSDETMGATLGRVRLARSWRLARPAARCEVDRRASLSSIPRPNCSTGWSSESSMFIRPGACIWSGGARSGVALVALMSAACEPSTYSGTYGWKADEDAFVSHSHSRPRSKSCRSRLPGVK